MLILARQCFQVVAQVTVSTSPTLRWLKVLMFLLSRAAAQVLKTAVIMIFQVVPQRTSLLILRRPPPALTRSVRSAPTSILVLQPTLPQSLPIRRLQAPLQVRSMLARSSRYPLMAVQSGLMRRLVQAPGVRQVLFSPAAHGC